MAGSVGAGVDPDPGSDDAEGKDSVAGGTVSEEAVGDEVVGADVALVDAGSAEDDVAGAGLELVGGSAIPVVEPSAGGEVGSRLFTSAGDEVEGATSVEDSGDPVATGDSAASDDNGVSAVELGLGDEPEPEVGSAASPPDSVTAGDEASGVGVELVDSAGDGVVVAAPAESDVGDVTSSATGAGDDAAGVGSAAGGASAEGDAVAGAAVVSPDGVDEDGVGDVEGVEGSVAEVVGDDAVVGSAVGSVPPAAGGVGEVLETFVGPTFAGPFSLSFTRPV